VTLAEAQALLFGAVTGEGDPAGELRRRIAGSAELGPEERVAIHARMYRARVADALRDDFPKLAALVGAERFGALSEAYARAHPSRHPDLGRMGRWLPAFLRARPAAARRDLADLAALEWARAEVFLEADVRPVGREAIAALPPAGYAAARLRLVPALRLVALEHDVADLWRRLEDGAPPPPPAPARTALAVWRSGWEVFHARLDLHEAAALERAALGDPLASVCAPFSGRDDPGEAALAALASWLDEGWVASVERGGVTRSARAR
jgi:hypothetical protein